MPRGYLNHVEGEESFDELSIGYYGAVDEKLNKSHKYSTPKLLFLCLLLCSSGILFYSYISYTYDPFYEYYIRFKRSSDYDLQSPEYELRKRIYHENMKLIRTHNAEPGQTSQLAENQFADLSWNEFSTKYFSAKSPADAVPRPDFAKLNSFLNYAAVGSLPDKIDWHEKGCVTPVKDQSKCGSCWAFSSTGAIEGAICAKTKQLISLSEQQLIDCSGPEGTMGCNGGFMDNAFQYVLDNGGICLEDDYPYEAMNDNCRASACKPAVKIVGLMDIPSHSEEAMMAALAQYGPVAAGIEGDKPAFQFYKSGVFRLKCGKRLNHAILVTGYGSDEQSGEPYWLVKNSWGESWGDHGYIKLSRAVHKKNGECGILLAPTIPLVEN